MHTPQWKLFALALVVTSLLHRPAPAADVLVPAARDIPVIAEVDVLVVGGASAGVAAAVAAANKGAKVFLAADRWYLGDDLCGPLRLWIDPSERPDTDLGRALFTPPEPTADQPASLPFTYTTSMDADPKHPDTGHAILNDHAWRSPVNESVQYNGDVTLTADLHATQTVHAVRLHAFGRTNDFGIEEVAVETSSDGKTWTPARTGRPGPIMRNEACQIHVPVEASARYVRLAIRKPASCSRVLLGEVVIESTVPRAAGPFMVTPMHVKKTLDDALRAAKVDFLLSAYPVDVLRDPQGRIVGVILSSRSGRQAVAARIVIDATARATVARLAGAEFDPYPSGDQTFTRVVATETAPDKAPGVRVLPGKIQGDITEKNPRSFIAAEHALTIPMKDGSFRSFTEAGQIARDRMWRKGQGLAAETLFQVPPDALHARGKPTADWPGAAAFDLDALLPTDVDGVAVLGGCAGVSRTAAAQLLQPSNFLHVGERLGVWAAEQAKVRPAVPLAQIRGTLIPPAGAARADVRDVRPALKPIPKASMVKSERPLPVVGAFDVVVVGGGTAGAPAGIGAARQGARTLLVEYQYNLGGVGTLGMIGRYWYGNQVGFTAEIDRTLPTINKGWNIEERMEWYRRELRKAGAEIWFGALATGVWVENGAVKGVIVATPDGPVAVRAAVVVDATGAADLAAAAGAPTRFIEAESFAVQGAGLSPRAPGANYTNTDWEYVDDTDVRDTTRMYVVGRSKFAESFDLGGVIGSRERRSIVGGYTLSPLDIVLGRKFADTVVVAQSNLDSHGYTVHPLFRLGFPGRREVLVTEVPYRCLVPQGVDNLLAAGLGMSVHRDAWPIVRMQPDLQNQGYAAGAAAAMSAKDGVSPRALDVRKLQRHLVQIGNIPAAALDQRDSPPPDRAQVAEAVARLEKLPDFAAVLAAPAETSVPLLREAYAKAQTPERRRMVAHMLGLLGDHTGVETLIEEVRSSKQDQGWEFQGSGNHGSGWRGIDSEVAVLGQLRTKEAVPVLLGKLAALDATSSFSHFRAITIAFENLADPQAAEPLAKVLRKPNMSGYDQRGLEGAIAITPPGGGNTSTRETSLREIMLARALVRCGDYEGLGKATLERYTADARAIFAWYATESLKASAKP